MSLINGDIQKKNRRLSIILTFITFSMIGLSFASVPLYDLFCRATGFGGTTQQSNNLPDVILDRVINIRFDASTNSILPWDFKPEQLEISMRVGETGLAFYRAKNNGNEPFIGTASFNVTPQKAGPYFTKIDCFCFTSQRLNPGQEIDMPVTFFVDPSIADNPNLDDVKTITLSYSMFEADAEEYEDYEKENAAILEKNKFDKLADISN